MSIIEIQQRQSAPKAIQIAWALRDRDQLLELVQEIVSVFDENQDKPGEAVEEILVTWGLICPF